MKKIASLSSLMLLSVMSYGQIDTFQKAKVFTESDTSAKFHTVSGERHGPSFFKKHKFPEVEYVPGEKLTFDKYHTVNVMYHWYEKWAELYPEIVDLYIIGESFEGRPIYQMTLTNKKTGKDTEKPAAYFEGGRHSGEITASESVLWLTQHLLEMD